MGIIDDMQLGGHILRYRNNGLTLDEIVRKLAKSHGCTVSTMTISKWLKSDSAQQTDPSTTSELDMIRDFCITFGRNLQKLKKDVSKKCADQVSKFIKDTIAEVRERHKGYDL